MKKKKGRKEGEGGETERRNKTKNRAHTLYYPNPFPILVLETIHRQ